jgi:hypothetical protein
MYHSIIIRHFTYLYRLSNQNGDCIFKLDYWKLVDAHHIDTHIKSIMSTNADQYVSKNQSSD